MNQAVITKENVQEWLVNYLAQILQVSPDEIDTNKNFKNFGLDSVTAVGLSGDLGSWIERELDPTVTYDYPTIEKLSEHLASGE